MNLPGTCHVRKYSQGFTLVELLLVVALIFVVALLTFPVGLNTYRAEVLHSTTDGIMIALRKAQRLAVTGENDQLHGVKILPNTYVLFEGDSYATRNVIRDEVYARSPGVTVSGPDEVIFGLLHGVPNTSGTLTLTIADRSKSVIIGTHGYITQ
jgi:prepilin-type N-terminal cleavage/methylation domain-containing protein